MVRVKTKVFHVRTGEGGGLIGEELERRLNEWLASLDQGADLEIVNTQQTLYYDVRWSGNEKEQGFLIYTVLYQIHESSEE